MKAGWLIPLVDERGWQVKLCDSSLKRANLSALEMSIAFTIKRCPAYLLILTYKKVLSLP